MKKSQLKSLIKECIQEILLEKKKDPCWKGYTQYGTKKKNGKEVPNCVPTNENCGCGNPGCMCDGECNCADKIEEGGGKCTKANTKKTSSDRKDKKWTKCSQGKRIHWGDPNAKTSPGSKRAKNFKKRHGCSSAKPGTPKYQACKDW
jgi:hypothetical protein